MKRSRRSPEYREPAGPEAHAVSRARSRSERPGLGRLQNPEALYQSIFELSPEGAVLTDATGKILDVNQAICQTLGYGRAELLGQSVRRFVPAEDLRHVVKHLTALRAGRHLEHEVWNQRKDGQRCLMQIHEKPLRLPNGRLGILITSREVTRTRQAERLQEVFLSLAANLSGTRAPREAARAIFAAADQLWRWDAGTLDVLSPQTGLVETVLHCDVIKGRRQELATTAQGSRPSARFRRILARGAELSLRPADAPPPTDTVLFGDCARVSASVMAVPVRTERQAVGVLSLQSYQPVAYTPADLRTLQALAEYCANAMVRIQAETESHRLERQILDISENERARLGQELHDGLCQDLVSLAFDANVLTNTLSARHRPEGPLARRLTDYLDRAITQCRQLAHGLFPVRLEIEGLPAALEQLAQATSERFQVRCQFVSRQPLRVAENVTAMHLYRIAQEALTNAIRHSRARTVTLQLKLQAGALQLSIEDDGIGLASVRDGKAKGLGLHIMHYRARAIGGTLRLDRGRQGGTLVTCSLPQWESGSALPEV